MLQTLRTLIVDDEPLAIERLQILAGQQDGISLVGTASDGASALRMVDALAPDLLLCDIAMPDLNGLEVAAAIERLDNPPAIVFVTAFDRYAVAAFEVAAVDYLLKPVAPDRLARALSRVREWRAAERAPAQKSKWITEFWVQNRGEMLRIDAAQVDLIEAERDYMRLHVGARSWLIHQTIKSLEARMNPDQFMRIHRSKMIRRDGIVGLKHHGDGAWSVDLGEGGVHRIGRTYLHDVKAIMHA
ncbi:MULTISPECIES: LytR/AlgR family response regulator transcription factor [unclassified Sphingopyxis]|jgi:DNA-binding LytR/AlgR family response regulator|uniref:LytR/AlgR family response regulator transcription factor n=1 Tax=unclassified Sphingopyxis TaxID=2614943 RepID=UPI000DC62EDD|nr:MULTISPECIES: response regulator transcription factor [unclassified Sphingopyxis]BBB12090.1 response regulator receiver protein [Sphingopyxis sp. FD7]